MPATRTATYIHSDENSNHIVYPRARLARPGCGRFRVGNCLERCPGSPSATVHPVRRAHRPLSMSGRLCVRARRAVCRIYRKVSSASMTQSLQKRKKGRVARHRAFMTRCDNAHATCSRTMADGSSRFASRACTSASICSGSWICASALPIPIARLRCQRS